MPETFKVPMEQHAPDIESSSAEYRTRFSGEVGGWFLEVQNCGVRHVLKGIPELLTVIDFGGGHGQNIKVFHELGAELTITGSDSSCCQLIQPELAAKQCSFSVQSLLKTTFEDKSFSLALSFRMLPHLADWSAHIEELCRVSDKGVIVEFPSSKSINALSGLMFNAKKKIEKNTRMFSLFRLPEIEHEFEKHGFELCLQYKQFFLPMAFYRLLKGRRTAEFTEGVFRRLGFTSWFGSPVICLFLRKE